MIVKKKECKAERKPAQKFNMPSYKNHYNIFMKSQMSRLTNESKGSFK